VPVTSIRNVLKQIALLFAGPGSEHVAGGMLRSTSTHDLAIPL
jgi:hypothetical protein